MVSIRKKSRLIVIVECQEAKYYGYPNVVPFKVLCYELLLLRCFLLVTYFIFFGILMKGSGGDSHNYERGGEARRLT